MVISTGMTSPRIGSVAALYALTNSMMFTPCGPSAVPTGGAGVAAPAFSATLTSAATFLLAGILVILFAMGCGFVRSTGRGRTSPGRRTGVGSDFLNLREGQVHRGLPAENLHQRLEPLAVGVDLGDRRMDPRERAVDDHHRITDREVGDLDLLLPPVGAPAARGDGSDDTRREHLLHLV